MNLEKIFNTPLTRVQAFVVVMLSVLTLFGALGTMLLVRMDGRQIETDTRMPIAHGIETTWPSARGANRLWSLDGGAGARAWIEDHVATLDLAQQAMPPTEKKP